MNLVRGRDVMGDDGLQPIERTGIAWGRNVMDVIDEGQPPMGPDEWREYLRSYSDDYLRTLDQDDLERWSEVQRDQRWLGFAPATEAQVAAAEERLGLRLPAGYRNFLLTSNGWSAIAPWIDIALPVEEIGWFRDVDEQIHDIWAGNGLEEVEELMERALSIARGDDGDLWLLDPGQAGEDGEWVAYSWDPSNGEVPQPAPGFSALVVEKRRLFEELRAQAGRPVRAEEFRGRDGRLEGAEGLLDQGRRQALAGDVTSARVSFAEARTRGSALAAYLDALLAAFLEPARAEMIFRNGVLTSGRTLRAIDEKHLWAEFIPLYARASEGRGDQLGYLAERLAKYVPELALPQMAAVADEKSAVAFYEAVRIAVLQPPLLPEPPEFQQALDAARRQAAEGDDEGAWATIEAALPTWWTDSPYRVAPVVLLVDPALRSVVTPDRFSTIVTIPRGDTSASTSRRTLPRGPNRNRPAKKSPGRPKLPAVPALSTLDESNNEDSTHTD